jgi:hypothetical protein
MSGAFEYRPKFVDIRIRPPKAGEERVTQDDVYTLKPGQKVCDWQGCRKAGEAKAPKSRDLPGDHYWFCQPHAAEYNRSWDFFAGMTEAEIRRRREEEQVTGGRPTWQFKASRLSREAAAFASKAGTGQGYADPHGVFGAKTRRKSETEAPQRRLGKMERQAFADLDLDDAAAPGVIRARYAELVKRCHPDANGGDRSAESRLQRVLKAYKVLQKAKLV